MATKSRNEYLEELITELKSKLVLSVATTDVPVVFKATEIERGPIEIPSNLPNLILYVYEGEEVVERANKYNKRTLPLFFECYFLPRSYCTSLSTTSESEIANIFLKELQLALNSSLFAGNPVIEIGNEIFYIAIEANRMAIRIDTEVKYVTDY